MSIIAEFIVYMDLILKLKMGKALQLEPFSYISYSKISY